MIAGPFKRLSLDRGNFLSCNKENEPPKDERFALVLGLTRLCLAHGLRLFTVHLLQFVLVLLE